MLYWLVKGVLTPVLRVTYRIKVEGREHLPKHGPVIIAANHRSFLDSIFLPLLIGKRRMTFVAKAEYFDKARTRWFFRGVGQIPIRREGGSASQRALDSATEVLEHDGVFGIYPEGTRTRSGKTHRGHTGVARLALRTGAPIVPVGLVGTDECQPTDKKLPRPFRTITVRIGAPILSDRFQAGDDHLALRRLTDEVMFEIVQLCGCYEYEDVYATKQAEDLPVEPVRLPTFDAQPVTRVA